MRSSNYDLKVVLTNLQIGMSKIRLRINCTSCSSREMEVLISHISNPEAIAYVSEVANDNFEYATSLLGGKCIQIQIDRILSEAPVKCPHNSKYDSYASVVEYKPFSAPTQSAVFVDFLLIIVAVCLILICFIVLPTISVSRIRQRRHLKYIQPLSTEEMAICDVTLRRV